MPSMILLEICARAYTLSSVVFLSRHILHVTELSLQVAYQLASDHMAHTRQGRWFSFDLLRACYTNTRAPVVTVATIQVA